MELMTPRKPNSAKRKFVKVGWFQSRGFFFVRKQVNLNVYVPGQLRGTDYEPKKNSDLLIRGQGAKDLPGIKYSIIRGHKKSLKGLSYRKSSRSKYGTKRLLLPEDRRNFFKYKGFKYI
jgi:small subunit ribosomal protein S12